MTNAPGLLVYRCTAKPADGDSQLKHVVVQTPPPLTIRVLPTMTLRLLRLKLLKALKIPASSARLERLGNELSAFLVMDDGSLSELDFRQEHREVAWWGVQDGSRIVVYVE